MRTALVTGASRGIGRAIARRLAAEGLLVAVHYNGNEAAAKETVGLIEEAGGRAFAIGVPLGEPGDAERLWSAFDAGLAGLGAEPGVDVIVNNAGIARSADLHAITPEEFDEVFAVNVRAPFFIVRHGLSRLRPGGRIVNISSGATRVAMPQIIAYSMTKGALDTFSMTLAQDRAIARLGATVNSVSPGVIETDVNAQWLADPQARRHTEQMSPFGRVGQPADVADIVALVASAGARWLSGQDIDATGAAGYTV
ncbi:SDR family oxidoreductase [Dactylosporangium darangshiense]|uniref:SDR family oxidoreductase n=1 Tax=Dactylosporangium darangshiense TaxID=579108 RepID=A0ABP8DL07_9ACTN